MCAFLTAIFRVITDYDGCVRLRSEDRCLIRGRWLSVILLARHKLIFLKKWFKMASMIIHIEVSNILKLSTTLR